MVSIDFLLTNGKTLFLAYDQGMEHGPADFDDENIDPNYILDIAVKGKFNAVIFQKGIAEKYYTGSEAAGVVPLIIKLNGKTNLVENEDPYSPLLCTVDEAVGLGAKAVGYTIYVGSEFENKMTSEFAEVVRDAHAKNIPVIGWMYPRGKNIAGKDKATLIAYGARMGLELGADIVKIQYPRSLQSLQWAVESAGKTKVVVSGGSKVGVEEFLEQAKIIMQSGAIGMAVGRNIWQHENPLELTEKLKAIVFG